MHPQRGGAHRAGDGLRGPRPGAVREDRPGPSGGPEILHRILQPSDGRGAPGMRGSAHDGWERAAAVTRSPPRGGNGIASSRDNLDRLAASSDHVHALRPPRRRGDGRDHLRVLPNQPLPHSGLSPARLLLTSDRLSGRHRRARWRAIVASASRVVSERTMQEFAVTGGRRDRMTAGLVLRGVPQTDDRVRDSPS